ncbi:MFSD3 [Bugula neritina]|uniref:MFSD3 n=1 Tax=Bugula neritina TaxID=10212 RepID=A0A7J7KJZ7_BUGNE|nr:MFSD3 [Bugula neritina]
MPYGIQIKFLPIILRKHGVSLSKISLFKLLFLPWVFKLLWAPLVDKHGTKKQWLIGTTTLLALTCLLTASVNFYSLSSLALMLFMQNICVSVQDISVDALAVSILSTEDVGLGNVAQVTGYKVGGVLAGVMYMMVHNSAGHGATYIILALVYAVALVLIHFADIHSLQGTLTPNGSSKHKPLKSSSSQEKITPKEKYFSTLFQAVTVEGSLWMIVYTCVYKCGENASIALVPLLLLDKGVSDTKVAFCTGVVGSLATIVGSLVGGVILKRFSAHASSYMLNIGRVFTMVCITILVGNLLSVTTTQDNNYADILICLCCVQLFLSGISSILTFSWMMHLSQNAPASIQSTNYTALATSEILGKLMFSSFIGYLPEYAGYQPTFYALLVSVMAVALMTFSTPKYLRGLGCPKLT